MSKSKKRSSGESIKSLANTLCVLGAFSSVLLGLSQILLANSIKTRSTEFTILGIIIIVFGCWGSYMLSRVLYGFGEIVNNTDKIAQDIHKIFIMEAEKADDYDYENYNNDLDEKTYREP